MNMNIKKRRLPLIFGAALVAILALPAFSADGDKSTIKGLITNVQGDTISLKDSNNADVTITVSPATTYKSTKGLTGVIHDKVQQSALITGLPITADVVAAGDGFNATAISFKAEDFRTAQQVQAGMATTKEGLAKTEERMDNFGTYDAVATVDVLFASGSAKISSSGQSDLMALAEKSKSLKDSGWWCRASPTRR